MHNLDLTDQHRRLNDQLDDFLCDARDEKRFKSRGCEKDYGAPRLPQSMPPGADQWWGRDMRLGQPGRRRAAATKKSSDSDSSSSGSSSGDDSGSTTTSTAKCTVDELSGAAISAQVDAQAAAAFDGSVADSTPETSPAGDLTKQPWMVGPFSEVLLPGVSILQHRFQESRCPQRRDLPGWRRDYALPNCRNDSAHGEARFGRVVGMRLAPEHSCDS